METDGRIYCIPESVAMEESVLLVAEEFPTTWSKVATLVPGAAIVDPTLFAHGQRWWLFGTLQDDCGQRVDDIKLFAWHAERLTGPWKPHALNPLKTDIRGSRPAGTPFHHAGDLYRPAQDSSSTYGGCVRIFKVRTLTPNAFAEEEVKIVRPPRDWPDGMHTLSSVGRHTLLDAKREIYALRPARQIIRRLANG